MQQNDHEYVFITSYVLNFCHKNELNRSQSKVYTSYKRPTQNNYPFMQGTTFQFLKYTTLKVTVK